MDGKLETVRYLTLIPMLLNGPEAGPPAEAKGCSDHGAAAAG